MRQSRKDSSLAVPIANSEIISKLLWSSGLEEALLPTSRNIVDLRIVVDIFRSHTGGRTQGVILLVEITPK